MLHKPHKGHHSSFLHCQKCQDHEGHHLALNRSTHHTTAAQVKQGIYLNNDVILLEGLVVEEAVQDILGSSSIPHLHHSQHTSIPSPICSKAPACFVPVLAVNGGAKHDAAHAYALLPGSCTLCSHCSWGCTTVCGCHANNVLALTRQLHMQKTINALSRCTNRHPNV